jgi:hypothetical protein
MTATEGIDFASIPDRIQSGYSVRSSGKPMEYQERCSAEQMLLSL